MKRIGLAWLLVGCAALTVWGCGGDDSNNSGANGGSGGAGNGGASGSSGSGAGGSGQPAPAPKAASCKAADGGGSASLGDIKVALRLETSWREGWLASPAVADLNGDGKPQTVVARGNDMLCFDHTGALAWEYKNDTGRIWASPVVADLSPSPGLEVAFASREKVIVLDAKGALLPGFPVSWVDEQRALAAADLNGDGSLELVVVPAKGGAKDIVMAWNGDGSKVAGFPPNETGTSGCDKKENACYITGGFDQNLALGDLNGDGKADIVVPHDNAYMSVHEGSGVAYGAAAGFKSKKSSGVRYLHKLAEAQQGYAENEDTALQAHFTNTPPAIADIDGDGTYDIIMLASVQNAAQSKREQGVALWAVHGDSSRLPGWEEPLHLPGYLSGLWDFGNNIVGQTNQVAVADLDPDRKGLEIVFAGFDGKLYGVGADKSTVWSYSFTNASEVHTPGPVVADLTGDGKPEIIFATYGSAMGSGHLFVLDAGGNELYKQPLSGRGSMTVPTIADATGDGKLNIVLSLKDSEDKKLGVLVYDVPGSGDNCLLWPTGRGNLRRTGFVPKESSGGASGN